MFNSLNNKPEDVRKEIEEFTDYVFDFYGGSDPLWDFFKDDKKPVTRAEIKSNTEKLLKTEHPWGGGDSFDREMVRDMMFITRGIKENLEYEFGLKKYGILEETA